MGKVDLEGRAAYGAAFDGNRAAVSLRDTLHEGQADSPAELPASLGGHRPGERLEKLPLILDRDRISPVMDRDHARRGKILEEDRDRMVVVAVLHGVRDEVLDRPHDRRLVPVRPDLLRRERMDSVAVAAPHLRDRAQHRRLEVEILAAKRDRLARPQARDVEHVDDHAIHPLEAPRRRIGERSRFFHRAIVHSDELHRHLRRRERIPEVVRERGDEAVTQVLLEMEVVDLGERGFVGCPEFPVLLDVGDDLRIADEDLVDVHRDDRDVGEEKLTVSADAQTLAAVAPVFLRDPQMHRGKAFGARAFGIKHVEVAADRFFRAVLFDPDRAGVPGADDSVRVDGEDRVVLVLLVEVMELFLRHALGSDGNVPHVLTKKQISVQFPGGIFESRPFEIVPWGDGSSLRFRKPGRRRPGVLRSG